MKRAIAFFIICILMVNLSYISFANVSTEEIQVYVDDTKIQFDVQPVFIKNRTMVPIRAVFEAMGALVEWDNDTKTATISKGIEVKIQLDNPVAQVDHMPILMDVPATGINGRILVPVRFISEAIGSKVEWDNDTKTVYINQTNSYNNQGNILNWGRFASDGDFNYHILEDGVLIRENINTNRQEKISDHVVCDLHIVNEWIYCIGIDHGTNKVIRFLKDNPGEKEIIIDKTVLSMQIVNDWIYYSSEDGKTLYRTNMEGSVTEEIIQNGDFRPKKWFVQDSFIYFRSFIKFGKICRARVNGTSVINIIYDSNDYELMLIDNESLYVVRQNNEQGVYKLGLSGGTPVKIMNDIPMAMNGDDEWLYSSVKTTAGSRLIKCKKDGSEIYTINEYKETDIPKNIYVNGESIYYSILRGNEELIFRMNVAGKDISTLVWVYGEDYYHVKDVLSGTSSANASLNSVCTMVMSTVRFSETTNIIVNEMKVNKTQSLFYQKLKAEDNDDLEIWMDKEYVYSKKPDETHWSIERIHEENSIDQNTVLFELIKPTSELCNNLHLSEEEDRYILSGTGAFPVFLRSFFQKGGLLYEDALRYIDSVTLELIINKNTFYLEEMNLELQYRSDTEEGKDGLQNISHFQYVNSHFNSVYMNLPYSVKQSFNAKKQADQNIEEGSAKLSEGKYQEAIQLFDKAIAVYDKAYNAYLYKGYAQYYQGNFEKAILTFEKYHELNPSDIEIFALQGTCYLNLGDLDKAEELANQVINTGKESDLALNLLGLVYSEKEEYREAYQFFEKAVSINNKYYDAHLNMASALFQMGSYTKCIQTIDTFLKRFPNNRDLYFLKARSLSRQGKSEEAIEVYEEILKMDPSNDFVTMTYIALEYEKLQDFDKAQEYADRAKAVYPDYSLLAYLLDELDYERFTLSSQKLVDFIQKEYLFYHETTEVSDAIREFVQKGESFSVEDVNSLVDVITDPKDYHTFVLSGSAFDRFINRYDSPDIEMTQDENAVYIRIKDFSPETGVMFTEHIQSIENPEEKALIIDLRNNSGGLSQEAGAILDVLLPECITSYFIERDGFITSNASGKSHILFDKIGILVNENTASSSELLALGLKMYAENVTIIGRPTMGKGVGQIVYVDHKKEFALFLVNHYWNVLQKNINGIGLNIDVTVGDDDPDYSNAIQEFIRQ